MTRIGILTGGGDCPGLNAVIRGVTARVVRSEDNTVLGFLNGWDGLMEDRFMPLDRDAVRGILGRGGTILGTSRRDPYAHGDGLASLRPALEHHGLESLIVVGGDGTLCTALALCDEGLPVVAVPKTIDNDISATDTTFGFDTAVQIVTDAIDRLATTAEAHNRVMLVEVMGRSQGWIAIHSGMAAGADVILIPEVQLALEEVAEIITRRHKGGRQYSIVVIAEGVKPPFEQQLPTDIYGFTRLGGVAFQIAPILEELTGYETRVTVLGHLQRGGTPTAYDRILATRLGVAAADLALDGESRVMVSLRGTEVRPVPLDEACRRLRAVDPELFEVAQTFFG